MVRLLLAYIHIYICFTLFVIHGSECTQSNRDLRCLRNKLIRNFAFSRDSKQSIFRQMKRNVLWMIYDSWLGISERESEWMRNVTKLKWILLFIAYMDVLHMYVSCATLVHHAHIPGLKCLSSSDFHSTNSEISRTHPLKPLDGLKRFSCMPKSRSNRCSMLQQYFPHMQENKNDRHWLRLKS